MKSEAVFGAISSVNFNLITYPEESWLDGWQFDNVRMLNQRT